MTKERLFEAIGGIDERYLTENLKKRRHAPRWIAAAACVAVVCSLGAFWPAAEEPAPPVPMPTPAPSPEPGEPIIREEPPADIEDHEPMILPLRPGDPNIPAEPGEPPFGGVSYFWVERSDIFFNQLSDLSADAALRNFDWDLYEYRTWTEEEICRWFEQDLSPGWVPEGLQTTLTQTVIAQKGGDPEVDMVSWHCYDGYDRYGGPATSGGIPAPRGFTLTASRLGYAHGCCLYTLPEDEVAETIFCDTPVIFARREMPYGPYDPETHEPAGTYTLCTAEFTTPAGVECTLTAHQLEEDDVVKIVASILCDATEVFIREE